VVAGARNGRPGGGEGGAAHVDERASRRREPAGEDCWPPCLEICLARERHVESLQSLRGLKETDRGLARRSGSGLDLSRQELNTRALKVVEGSGCSHRGEPARRVQSAGLEVRGGGREGP